MTGTRTTTTTVPAGGTGPVDWRLRLTEDGPTGGPVLVLGHSLGSSHVMWDDVVAALVPDVHVVRYDLPGHGGSPVAPLDRPMTMDDVTAALLRSLDAAGIGSFHVGGLSFGGLVALAVAEGAPARVGTLTVMSSGPANLPGQPWRERAAAVRRDGTAPLADATMERWFSEPFRDGAGAGWVRRIRAEFVGCDPRGYAQCCEVLSTTDLRPGLATLSMPVLLVSAEEDGALPWPVADGLAERMREGGADVTVCRVPGARHMCAVEQPDLVARALRTRLGLA